MNWWWFIFIDRSRSAQSTQSFRFFRIIYSFYQNCENWKIESEKCWSNVAIFHVENRTLWSSKGHWLRYRMVTPNMYMARVFSTNHHWSGPNSCHIQVFVCVIGFMYLLPFFTSVLFLPAYVQMYSKQRTAKTFNRLMCRQHTGEKRLVFSVPLKEYITSTEDKQKWKH